jgi:hypothetical protein
MHVSKAMAGACVALVAAAILPVGCDSSTSAPESREELSILQVGQLFHRYQKAQKSPPQGLKDLASAGKILPAAVESIRSKEVLVYWGEGISDAPEAASTVLAYQKDVPEKGGEVLMQDGTARKMTATEFQAARKPPGATTEGAAPTKKK